jgi:hypothetical protein
VGAWKQPSFEEELASVLPLLKEGKKLSTRVSTFSVYLVFNLTESHQAIRLPFNLLVPSADADKDLAYS